ncbi:L-type lectin-domain containing receptor kinase IX.1 [Sorghum bicolor]|uniref:non-specific serine/threonine protein kinase n=1 Tax=Sorghum bicolor TaxID=4558 RepID=A0A1B6PT98_SORBI|nr:L-type lectin-domain containing receptor kinase IX.1 [Sorghum bicolor]KXG28899.1 hypothetical protein SORBI_3005G181200 [Sorghum bicolor]|eukprot:XP_021317422.1 L-type lectin-domain containing receptor kinase IX.1 [Sorghum bicolor]
MGTKIPVCPSMLFFLLCCSLFSTHVPRASSLSFNLSFSDPASACGMQINCNNTYIDGDKLELTRNDIVQGTGGSIGRATYAKPVPLWRAGAAAGGAKLLASFTTSFTFRITPDSSLPTGDGMAFFLTPYSSATEIPPGSGGVNLGLLAGGNSTGDSRFVFVAVEFDTWSNPPPAADINGSHMGIDNTSMVSMASTNTSSPTGNLTSNINMVATISYHNDSELLTADLLINDSSYHVNTIIDLSTYLPEDVAVGFSASTGKAGEMHTVFNWSFSSTLASTSETTANVVGTSNKLQLLLILLVPILSLLLCAAGTYLFLVRRRHEAASGSSDDSEEQFELERGVAAAGGGPKRYTYGELANTTSNFAEEKKLGRGGFGSVYLGELNVAGVDRAVAIKMLSSESSAQGRREFEAEVRIISRLKHRNLVQLLGWCDSRRNGLMLVYEMVAKGSLDRHLYSQDTFLTWPQRYKIILGLGSALRYLHKEWEQCIVHGDIKPSNIMLDESHGTKLGDFGLARLVDHGAGWQTTKAVLGTAGYIDPEFVNTRRPSTYSDVYSFGIVLLEIVCNRPPVQVVMQQNDKEAAAGEEQKQQQPPLVLLKWVWSLYGQSATLDAADERLRGDELDEECMERVLVVGLWCAHPDPSERPSIEQAMHVLQSEDKRLLPVLPPQMYKTMLDVPIQPRAYGALSIDAYSGTSSSTTTGNTNPSYQSPSSALLRNFT